MLSSRTASTRRPCCVQTPVTVRADLLRNPERSWKGDQILDEDEQKGRNSNDTTEAGQMQTQSLLTCHEMPSRWNLRHLRYTRNDPPPVDGMPTLHLRLNEGNLQKTKEPHQILSSEQSMKIIMDYVRENEELARRI